MSDSPKETRVLELDCSNRDGQLFKLKTGALVLNILACWLNKKNCVTLGVSSLLCDQLSQY